MRQASEGEGKGKDERVKREKIGRRMIALGGLLPPALILTFLPSFLHPATQAMQPVPNAGKQVITAVAFSRLSVSGGLKKRAGD